MNFIWGEMTKYPFMLGLFCKKKMAQNVLIEIGIIWPVKLLQYLLCCAHLQHNYRLKAYTKFNINSEQAALNCLLNSMKKQFSCRNMTRNNKSFVRIVFTKNACFLRSFSFLLKYGLCFVLVIKVNDIS